MNHLKKGLVDLLRVTNPSSAVNSTTPLDFRASGLSGSGMVLTCCEFRPRRGNALGIRKRVESLLCKQWNPEQLRAGSRVRRDGVSVVSGWAVLLIWTSAGAVTPEQVQQHGQAQQASLEMFWIQDFKAVMLRTQPSCCTVSHVCSWRETSLASNPSSTATPPSRRISSPAPLTLGCGSRRATTTRAIPLRTSSCAQEGVRPWNEQGSSVQ